MELSTLTTITHLPWRTTRHGYLAVRRISLPPQERNVASLGLQSLAIGALRCTGKFPGETVSEETSTGVNEFGVEKRDVAVEDKNLISEAEAEAESESESSEQTQALEFLNDIKLDSDNTYSVLLYGSGAIVALYLTSAIVGSLESIPLLPKLMEVVGLGYTLWFTTRYLLFKRNREELKTKISEIKKQVLGSDSD